MFARSIRSLLLRQGYIPLTEVGELLARIGGRMATIDEHLAREYVIDPMPGGIHHKIRLMCERRRRLFDKIVAEELQARRECIRAG